MFRTLYAKLAVALFSLFVIVGAAFLVVSLYSAYLYQQEVAQRLNKDLAMYIVDEHVRVRSGSIDQEALTNLFHTVMVINPSLELYLLSDAGEVLAHSGDVDLIARKNVSLQPIKVMMSGKKNMPIFGDDPKSLDGDRAFSVAPIFSNGEPMGYIYAVLGSEQVDYISQLYQKSYIMRTGVGALVLALLFAFFGGLIIFFFLTKRLRILSRTMEVFRDKGFEQSISNSHLVSLGHDKLGHDKHGHDEIDAMTSTFEQMASQIQLQMMQLKRTDALRRELVANVSHDLRTPLASLTGYLEILLAKNEKLSNENRYEYLQIVSKNSERLNKMVAELFELAKLESGDLALHKETFSLAELTHDVVQKFYLRAEESHINIVADIDSDVPYVEADIGLIERVLDNLIDNALKNTPENGCITLSLNTDGKGVKINVTDTGGGIAKDDLPHIFQRFYKKNESDQSQSGAGLGLAIAQRIVQLHGSELLVKSILHQGTEFDFALPIPN